MRLFGDDWEHNRRQSIEQARACGKGIAPEHLVPDAIVTHGPSKHTGDRSGITVIWKVLATNGGHAALECVHGDYFRKIGDRTIIVISEHEWYPAEHLLDAIQTRPEAPDGEAA